jgi:hypothetical protein
MSRTIAIDEIQIEQSEATALVFAEDFQSESHFSTWISDNIHQFCWDVFDCRIKDWEREFKIGYSGRRVDFLITDDGLQKILVECKVPKDPDSEIPKAIGQLLSYKIFLEPRGIFVKRMILLSTKFSRVAMQIIEKYSLPIEFVVMDKTKRLNICLHPRVTNMP